MARCTEFIKTKVSKGNDYDFRIHKGSNFEWNELVIIFLITLFTYGVVFR